MNSEADMEKPPVKRGRKPKFSPEELERRTLEAAVEAVVLEGVAAGVDAIRIEKVLVDADTPRGATYEFWDAKGPGTSQQNLRRAAVIDILRNLPTGALSATAEYAMSVLDANAELLAGDDREAIVAFRAEAIRDVCTYNFQLLQDQRWRTYKALVSSIATQRDEELHEAVAAGEAALLETYGLLFGQFAEMFGLRLRGDYQIEHFTMSAYALNEGLSNRSGAEFARQEFIKDGANWTVFAASFLALVEHYFEFQD